MKDSGFGYWSFTLGLLLLLFAGVGCSSQTDREVQRDQYPLPDSAEIVETSVGEYGGIFIQASSGEPKTFNPLLMEDSGSSAAISMFTIGLLAWNEAKQEVEPGLAASWDVAEDQRTFTFHLRKGLFWSDGAPFSADDVIFTFKAVYDPRYPNRYAYDLSLDGEPFEVTKIDDYTVQISTPDIFAPFLQKMTSFVLPKHILGEAYENGTLQQQWGLNTAINHPEQLVGMGMFQVLSYRPGERMVFRPNPHYYRADRDRKRLPYIDFYIYSFTGDSKAAELAFSRGETDVQALGSDSLGWIERFAKAQDFTIYDRGPTTHSNFLWFNLHPGSNADDKPFVDPVKREWFEDVRFRQAVSFGINRESIIRGVFLGKGTPLWGPESPANTRWYNPNVHTYPYNPERSRELLREADFRWNSQGQLLDSKGNRVEFTLITVEESPIRRQMATIFRQNMEDLGINVTLRFMDFNTLVGRIADSYNYEACMLGLTGGGDPAGGMSVFHSSGRLHQWHPSQESPAREWEVEIDRLMVAQLKTLDYEERKQYWFRVQEIMSEQVPFIYLVTPNSYVGIKNRWKNLDLPTLGSAIWNLDVLWTPGVNH